jgi:hypothetical protein
MIEVEEIEKILTMDSHALQTMRLLELESSDLRSIIYYASGMIKGSRLINKPL